MVPKDVRDKIKVPDSDKPAELNITILRKMGKERARVIEYINNKKEADLLVEQSRSLDAVRERAQLDISQ